MTSPSRLEGADEGEVERLAFPRDDVTHPRSLWYTPPFCTCDVSAPVAAYALHKIALWKRVDALAYACVRQGSFVSSRGSHACLFFLCFFHRSAQVLAFVGGYVSPPSPPSVDSFPRAPPADAASAAATVTSPHLTLSRTDGCGQLCRLERAAAQRGESRNFRLVMVDHPPLRSPVLCCAVLCFALLRWLRRSARSGSIVSEC